MRQLLLLHNPSAGEDAPGRDELTRPFEAAGFAVHYIDLKQNKVRRRDAEAADLVAVAGGDGTIGRMVRRLEGAIACLTVLPMGSANNIAGSLGIKGEIAEIARGMRDGRRRTLDYGIAEGPWGRRLFLESVGIGALAGAMAASDEEDVSGEEKVGSGREAFAQVLKSVEPRRWEVLVDGEPLPATLLLVEVLNTPMMGPRLLLAREVEAADGLLDVAYLRPERRAEMIDWLEAEEAEGPAPLEVVCGRRVAMRWLGELALHVDDKFPDRPDAAADVRVTMANAPLRVLVPAQSGAEGRG